MRKSIYTSYQTQYQPPKIDSTTDSFLESKQLISICPVIIFQPNLTLTSVHVFILTLSLKTSSEKLCSIFSSLHNTVSFPRESPRNWCQSPSALSSRSLQTLIYNQCQVAKALNPHPAWGVGGGTLLIQGLGRKATSADIGVIAWMWSILLLSMQVPTVCWKCQMS